MGKKPFSLEVETMAMANIAKEIKDLPKESQQRIVDWLLSITGASKQLVSGPQGPATDLPSQLNVNGPSYPKGEDAKEFFLKKQPVNNYQKLAVLGYYLEFMKGKDEFNAQDLKIAWKQTREALPTAQVFSNSLNHTLTMYNYFVTGEHKGLYRMGIRGQKLVEALPGKPKELVGAYQKGKKKNTSS